MTPGHDGGHHDPDPVTTVKTRRFNRWLVLIGLAGLLRGLFWVAFTPVWYVVDEAHHYAYVENIATGEGLPVVGEDFVSEDVLRVAKESSTDHARSAPTQASLEDPSWGIVAEQYEGIQSPAYYLLMVPIYWASRPFGVLASIYALRVATVVVSLLAVPAIAYLARELFPTRRAVWLAAPGALVAVEGFNSNLAALTNDALLVPVTMVTYISMVRAARLGFTPRRALVTGLLLGAALLTKMTAIPVIVVVAMGILLLPSGKRQGLMTRVGFGLGTAFAALALLSPWLIRNRIVYGSFSSTNMLLTAPLQPRVPATLKGLGSHAQQAVAGFWQSQAYAFGTGRRYGVVIGGIVIALLILALVRSLIIRDSQQSRILVWLGSSFPLSFLTMVVVIYLLVDGLGTVFGRHLYAALPTLVLLLAAGPVLLLGARRGIALLFLCLAGFLVLEYPTFVGYADTWYGHGNLQGDLAPVVDQSFNGGINSTPIFDANAPCPVEAVGIGVVGQQSPPEVRISSGSQSEVATLSGHDGPFSLYRLASPYRERFRAELDSQFQIWSSLGDQSEFLSLAGQDGDPLARLYCHNPEPLKFRFAQLFPPQHPDFITYDFVRWWGTAWAGFGGGALLISAGLVLRRKHPVVEP